MLAIVEGGGIKYLTPDHLGTPRVITDGTGKVVSRHDYYPFGEEIGAGIGGRTDGMGFSVDDKVRQKFTGYERDNETGLDFAQARYYGSGIGRFTSTDPILVNARRLLNPQTFNGYSYTINNPLRFTDPNGEDLYVLGAELIAAVQKVAPGSKIDSSGRVSKPGFWHRVWNHLTGHGKGTGLISKLVDSSKVTTAVGIPGAGHSVAIDEKNYKSPFTSSPGAQMRKMGMGVREDTDVLVIVDTHGIDLPTTMADGSIQNQNAGVAVVAGHEFIHALHLITEGKLNDTIETHSFMELGVTYSEKVSREELRTVGLGGFNSPKDITENQLRRELRQRPRATYTYRKNWK